MKKLGRALLVLAAGLVSGLALVAGAAGTTRAHAAKVTRFQGRIQALALDGNRIAYDLSGTGSVGNKVLVWNARTGKTTKVSGKQTRGADDSSTGSGVFGLAIAGTHVAWLVNVGGNTEGDDYLFASSVVKPKERKVASATRNGDACTGGPPVLNPQCGGKWLLGLVGSGNVLALDRWTTAGGPIATSSANLLVLGKQLKSVASGEPPFLSVAAAGGRIAVVRSPQDVTLYSSSGKLLRTVHPSSARTAALSGRNLLVLTTTRTLELYNAETGLLRKTFAARGTTQPRNLDVQGNIAIYTTGSAVHAVNLSSGKDRVVAQHRGGPLFAAIDGAGLVHGSNGYAPGKGTIIFVPLARVTAVVS
jgi:hypothetical protein